jgi:hypothetical protein
MNKPPILITALALLLIPVNAQAMDQKALDCGVTKASPELREALTDATILGDKMSDDLLDQLRDLTNLCAEIHGFTPLQKSDYWTFVMTDIARLGIGAKLDVEGISPDVIDQTMGFGPGRSNPIVFDELTNDQFETLRAGMEDEGIVVDDIDAPTWSLLGNYIATTAQSEQARIAME